jgi:2-polyprenyl-3-methyl-5-hydroxy-6-metoxy-1,4-benzoquinol methylase
MPRQEIQDPDMRQASFGPLKSLDGEVMLLDISGLLEYYAKMIKPRQKRNFLLRVVNHLKSSYSLFQDFFAFLILRRRKTNFSFEGHYLDWRMTRTRVVDEMIYQHLDEKSLTQPAKTMLELGAGHGDFSQYFTDKGFLCTAMEGRLEHVNWMRKNTKIYSILQFDAEKPWLENNYYDVILHFGLLYHLERPLDNLAWTIDNLKFKIMFLETEVANHHDPEFTLVLREEGGDQALNNLGGRPTSRGIEALLESRNLDWVRMDNPELDSSIHQYSWKESETPYTWAHGLRRFYVIRPKDEAS